MTDAQQQASGPLHQALLQHFAEAASSVLSQIAGAALQAAPAEAPAAADGSTSEAAAADSTPEAAAGHPATLVRIEITGALQGLCEFALSAPMSAHFAALLTGEAPDLAATEISSDTREAAAELIQQICGNAADRLRRAFGPLELKPHLAEAGPDSGPHNLIRITGGDRALDFGFHILRLAPQPAPQPAAPQPAAPQLAAPQLAAQAPTESPTPPNAPKPPPSAPPAHSSSGSASSPNRNLDLLLDIELGVTLRFGTTHMPLKEILELCSGSVVELDRRVEEPVELLIDGRLIAHGEVVIVEGNYGLRVTQVAAPGEKIACLSSRT